MQHLIDILMENKDALFAGLLTTLELAVISCILATLLGIVLGVMASLPSKLCRFLVTAFVDIVRGIPLLVLAFFVFFGVPQITHIPFQEFTAGVVILTINAGAYVTEIVRGGIRAVSKGQKEASLAVGMTFTQSMQKVVLPQAFRIMLPQFVSQYIITLKDTTIISGIGLVELLMTGRKIVGRTFDSLNVYGLIAVFYIVVITLLTLLAKHLERKTNASLN